MNYIFVIIVIIVAFQACFGNGELATNIPPGKITNIITIMLENRSFNNMLGWLKRTNSEVNGLTGAEYNLYNVNDPNSEKVYVNDQHPYTVRRDLGHSIGAINEQVFGTVGVNEPVPLPSVAPMNGFVQNYVRSGGIAEEAMGAFNPNDVPISYALAQEFGVFDRWFCSVPGNTMPNRAYLHACTSEGMAYNDVPTLIRGHKGKMIYESVMEEGYNWVNYFQEVPATMVHTYPRTVVNDGNDHLRHYSRFVEDALSGNLPPLSYIDPRYFDFPGAPQNDNHPGNADVKNGEASLKHVYETLRQSPQWNSSLLIITYDEHGGFYDHVPTPLYAPNPDGQVHDDFDFDRVGVRVPTIMVSPWIAKGKVIHGPPANQKPTNTSEYEASSVASTIKKMWGLSSDFLTERDRWAGTFEHIFNDLSQPRTDCPMELPPAPTPTLQPDLNEPVMGLQEDFILFAAGLINDDIPKGTVFTELEGSLYVKQALSRYFGKCIYPKGSLDYFEGCEEMFY